MAKSARTVIVKVVVEGLEEVRELASIVRELKAAGIEDADIPAAVVGVEQLASATTIVHNFYPASGMSEEEIVRIASKAARYAG